MPSPSPDGPLNPSDRAIRARLASHTSWANTTDREKRTRAAREASPQHLNYWLRAIDPDGTMDPVQRQLRAESALKAHMTRLSLKAARVRQRNSRKAAS